MRPYADMYVGPEPDGGRGRTNPRIVLLARENDVYGNPEIRFTVGRTADGSDIPRIGISRLRGRYIRPWINTTLTDQFAIKREICQCYYTFIGGR